MHSSALGTTARIALRSLSSATRFSPSTVARYASIVVGFRVDFWVIERLCNERDARRFEARVERDQRHRLAEEAQVDDAAGGDGDSLDGHVVAPEMRAAGQPADDVGDVVMPNDETVGGEVDGLHGAMRVQRRGKPDGQRETAVVIAG